MKICTSCKTENDDTRVFCLNCRDRLPAAIPGSDPGSPVTKAQIDMPKIVVQHSEKKAIPRRTASAGRNYTGLFLSLLLWAILAALGFSIYLVSQAPDFAIASVENDASTPANLVSFLTKASTTPGGVWMGREDSINRFLSDKVRLRPTASVFGFHSEFQRCFVDLGDGQLDFVMEQKLSEYPLYFSLRLKPYSQDGRLRVRFTGASLGKLQIPAPLVPLLLGIWQPCFDSIDGVLEKFESASSASISPQSLVVRWPGKRHLTALFRLD